MKKVKGIVRKNPKGFDLWTHSARVLKKMPQGKRLKDEVDVLIRNSEVDTQFSNKCARAAQRFGEDPDLKDQEGRRDLKKIPFCTIDGETAKDFDDAVFGYREGKKRGVIVAIADVGHYVQKDSPIDIDALKRSTSIYYPGHCIPMIPESLSNGLCSLKPKVPRLCLYVQMSIGPLGKVNSVEVGEGVMKSQARLTYSQVQKLIDSDFKASAKIPKAVVSSIEVLREISQALRDERENRGSIDFDAVESVIKLNDQGEPVSIRPAERLEAHRLIEDLMIAANEAVARYLEERDIQTVFRIHEPPNSEKLKLFGTMAQSMGALTPAHIKLLEKARESPAALAKILDSFKDHPAKATLESALLRSMMQARYSSKNVGHYGLASKHYLHFTSPIRRYPDLIVHRILRSTWSKQKTQAGSLDEIADHCSQQERKATDLERQISALYATWFMQDKVGEQFAGRVTNQTDFGLFIRLESHFVEGLVHVSTLRAGLMERCSIGTQVQVRVMGVNLSRRFVDFKLV
ncbi:MAG: VacB/RNase II family 3'-5' exoribonuclease [Myxococcaceae bacterium]|nr:VacB/RNase II family 3'-5' exoribonuclease [Myxococcaceae bacterium]MBH2006459.1 VacB/RNase II family 3'-5' exoribonuclease [Myxococcaceae bacterium]